MGMENELEGIAKGEAGERDSNSVIDARIDELERELSATQRANQRYLDLIQTAIQSEQTAQQ